MGRPNFLAYQDQARAEQNKKLEAKTDAVLKKIDFGKSDAVEILAEIARTPASRANDRRTDQIKAIEVLANLLGWIAKPGEAAEGEVPAKPDIYKPAWMQ
jgi:hypothetical protein